MISNQATIVFMPREYGGRPSRPAGHKRGTERPETTARILIVEDEFSWRSRLKIH